MWFLYLLRCRDNTLYAGITTDLERRVREHNTSEKGAKYTRSRRPVTLVFAEEFENRSDASKAEYALKKCTRKEKEKKRTVFEKKYRSDFFSSI